MVHLYDTLHSIDREVLNTSRINRLSQSLDNDRKAALAVTMLTGAAVGNKSDNRTE
ncbi:MAG: hypothetical protein K2L07_16715 [Lachnospiraceae bacterium]|nr:hypothetical protein [Lachnospiraceae bacterium]